MRLRLTSWVVLLIAVLVPAAPGAQSQMVSPMAAKPAPTREGQKGADC